METSDKFVVISSLLCEPSRARILWSLLDGRAYTATELAVMADLSITSTSNHLSKLLSGEILKVEIQGRHRYYTFSDDEVAYVVESLANLAKDSKVISIEKNSLPKGVKYCRTCYDHLAGYIGVKIMDKLLERGYIVKDVESYSISTTGWQWLRQLEITRDCFTKNKRPIIRPCLDWSERRIHIAGQLGAQMLEYMLKRDWCRRVKESREIIFTSQGKKAMYDLLEIEVM